MKNLLNKYKNLIFSFSIRSLGMAFQFGLGIAVARFLGASGSGIYSIYTSWFNLLSNVMALGLPQLCTRKVSILFSQNNSDHIRKFAYFSFKIFAGISIPVVIVFYILNPHIASIFADGEEQGYILKLSAIAASAFIFLKFTSEMLRAMNKLNTAMAIESLTLPFLLTSAVYVIYLLPIEDKPTYFLITHISFLFFLSGVSWLLCNHQLNKIQKQSAHLADSEFSAPAKNTLFTFWLSSTLGIWFLNMPLLIAPIFSDLHDTGIFSAAYRLITVIVNVMMVLSGVYGPKFARGFNEKNYQLVWADLKKTGRISFAMFIPLFVAFFAVPEQILSMFGPDFAAGADWLRIMAVGQLIYSATGLVGLALNMMHQERLEMILMFISASVMLILMLVLGNFYDITGIAIGFAFGLTFKNTVSLFFARKLLKNLISPSS